MLIILQDSIFNEFFERNRNIFALFILFSGLSGYTASLYKDFKDPIIVYSALSLYLIGFVLTIVIFISALSITILDNKEEKTMYELMQKTMIFFIIFFLYLAIGMLGTFYYNNFPSEFIGIITIAIFVTFLIFGPGLINVALHKIPPFLGLFLLIDFSMVFLYILKIFGNFLNFLPVGLSFLIISLILAESLFGILKFGYKTVQSIPCGRSMSLIFELSITKCIQILKYKINIKIPLISTIIAYLSNLANI